MSELKNYILSHENWEEELTHAPYNLKISRYNNYILFKYSQPDSDFAYSLVREARGIIFYEPTWDIVCRPFDKFFNYGEPYAAAVNWNNVEITEKIDGSLIKVWYHDGWHISTNGTIDARKAEVGNFDKTFYDLFMEALGFSKNEFYQMLDCKYTYMFELVSPYNRVVIPYDETKIYYLAARNKENGMYVNYPLPIEAPASYSFANLKEIVDKASTFPWTKEGFVVSDGTNRIKVKSVAYVKAHYSRANGAVSLSTLVEIVRQGEEDEFLTYAPEYQEKIDMIKDRLSRLVRACMRAEVEMGSYCLNKKDYAIKVLSYYPPEVAHYLLYVFDHADDYFEKMTTASFIKTLHLKEGEFNT
jgi:hypothetical protein